MSDDGTMAAGAGGEAPEPGPKLYDASGEPIRSERRPTSGQADALAEYMKQRPVTFALSALIVGYLIGKLS